MTRKEKHKTLYATLSYYGSTHTSHVYTFDAASGSQRWISQPVDGMISPVVVDQNAVYFVIAPTLTLVKDTAN